MTPERWQRVKGLCNLALELERDQRSGFLAEACLGDEELRRDAESLIARASSGDGVPDEPVAEGAGGPLAAVLAREAMPEGGIPAIIGRYVVLRLIGAGGMGAVYEAEQDQPRRTVALKVIKPGFSSPRLLRRFELESQALGRLHHPGIAQIYEAGSADTGFGPQPYFAMEFIHGEPLCDYAEKHHLNLRQRLELISKVCDAVDHAHQRGIIHRDLKPGNILVEESGQPKILDFGVARVTDSDAQATRQTDLGQLVGTLAYMSPEQVLADPLELDTRSDVYALGVILYELLAKRLPYEVGYQLLEAVRTIREEEPTKLSSISRNYRGDVETIVSKALEKDKSRRYSSAAALAADIRRYLGDEPITARPASASYQLRKFARRHKALVSGIAAVFVVLVVGIVASTWEAVRARRAEQAALAAQQESKAVNDFLQNDLLAQASANTQAGPNTKPDPHLEVRTALDRAAAKIGPRFAKEPEVEAPIRDTMGQTYMDLGLYPDARRQLERALELHRRLSGPNDPRTLKTMSRLGRTAWLEGRSSDAEALLSRTLEMQRRVLGSEHPDTLFSMNNLAYAYYHLGKYAQAEGLAVQAVEIQRRVLGSTHPDTLDSTNVLADCYYQLGKYAQAEALNRQNLEIQKRILGAEHPSVLTTMNNLANAYQAQGEYAEAEKLESQVLEIDRRALGPEHPDTLRSMSNLAYDYLERGKYAQAEALGSQTVEMERRVFGPEHHETLLSMDNLALTEGLLGRYPQAERELSRTLEIGRRALGPEHSLTLAFLSDLTYLYQREGKYALAETYAAQTLAGQRHALGLEHRDTMDSAADLALAYLSQHKFAESEPLAREALEFDRKKQPEDWRRFRAESLLGASLAGQKNFTEAEPLLLEGYEGMSARKGQIEVPAWYHLDRAREWLAELYQAWGKPDQAAEWRGKN